MMGGIEISKYDPEPDEVSIRSHEVKGKPRRVVDIGGLQFYGSPEGLVDVFAKALELLGYSSFAAGMRPLAGDHTFLTGAEPIEMVDRSGTAIGTAIGMLVPPSTLPGDVVEIHQIGGPSVRIKVDSVTPHPGGGQVVSGTVEPKPGVPMPFEMVEHDRSKIEEAPPFEGEGGPTDA